MKTLTALLALLTLALPVHAGSPRLCRNAATPVNRLGIVSHVNAHQHNNHSHLVVTAFAVPVAVPVGPFAPYWYGVSDYYAPSSPGSASRQAVSEAVARESTRDAERRGDTFPRGAWERERVERSVGEHSLLSQHCISCHGRTSPKQGLSLVDPRSLSADSRFRAIRAVVLGEMPPDTSLNEVERAALLRELVAGDSSE
jgi:hypothetical protein